MNNNISIIVPLYNAEMYIEDTLESIINQSYKNFELILIDDGSKDKSLQICNSYSKKDSRIKVIHIDNHGVSYARNLGIEKAIYDYMIFVDSDDLLSNNALENINRLINDCEGFDLIQTRHIEFYDDVPEYYDDNYNNYMLTDEELVSATTTLLSGLTRKDNIIIPGPWCKIYKRDNLINWNIRFNENFFLFEDGIFNLEYLTKSKKVYISSSNTYFYRLSNVSSATSSFKSTYLEQRYKMIDYIKKIVSDNNYDIKYYNIFCIESLLSIYYFYLFNPKRPSDFKSAKTEFKEILDQDGIKDSLRFNFLKYICLKKKIIVLLSIMKQYMLLKLIYNMQFKKSR